MRISPTVVPVKQHNIPFLVGVNTKQLSNQMLELTKVINELKDVLIQQVTYFKQFLWVFSIPSSSALTFRPDNLFQVKETSFLRNTISECQACGKNIFLFHSPTTNMMWNHCVLIAISRSGWNRGGETEMCSWCLFPRWYVHWDSKWRGVCTLSWWIHWRWLQLWWCWWGEV